MKPEDGSDVYGSESGAPIEGDSRAGGVGRSKAPRRFVAVCIALVISGDIGALVVRRNQAEPGSSRRESVPTVLFRDDFSASTLYRADGGGAFDSGVRDGTFRLRSERGFDLYHLLPVEAPDRPKVLQTQDVSVAVDVQMTSPDTDDWFGIFCRFGGFGTDTYVARIMADGSWTIFRTSIGDQYVKRVLGGGAPGIEGALPADAPVHLRLDCVGQVETSLTLHVNGTVVGTVTDPSGLAPGDVGMAGSSPTGLMFDNLVVTEIT